MSGLWPGRKIKRFLLTLEDPERPLLGPNIWLLRKIGLIMPENNFAKFVYIVLHEFVTLFVVTQYMELFDIRSNLDAVITNLKISMLSIVCIVKSNTYVFWQKSWLEVIDYVTAADKDERNDVNNNRARILDSYTKYCRRISYSYWFLVFTTFIAVTTTPLMIYVSEKYLNSEENKGDMEEFYHIFSSWTPFDKYHSPGSWFTVVVHTWICAYGGVILSAYDSSAMVIMVFIGGKLDLLRDRCKELLGVDGRGLTEEEATENIRKMHRSHVLLMKYSKMFDSLLSPVMFLYVVMCSLMLCASAFQLTSATNATQKLLMAEYLIFGIAQLFMFCWHSDDVLYKSELLIQGPYGSDWLHSSVKQRRALLLLSGQMKKTLHFTAGPFTDLTLPTFITIVKGAYSYYTLLRD